MSTKLFEIVGWYGAGAILLAYFLLSFNFILSDSSTYQILNATGALGIVLISVRKKIYQPAVLNLVWFFIALVALVPLFM